MALRDYVLNNFWWKLLSLLLAALTWLTIGTAARNEQKQQENLRESPVVTGSSSRSFPSVPLTLLTSASNSAHFTVTPATVLIVVSGKPEDLTKLQLRDIRALVDVTDADDEMRFRRTIQVQVPKDFIATSRMATASVERVTDKSE